MISKEDPFDDFDSALNAMGWTKNAFVLSFYLLGYHKNYEGDDFFRFALKKAISVGGDTDTNACIVGGIVGALLGFKKIPAYMIGKVLSFDCTKNSIRRDKHLSAKYNAMQEIKKLIENRAVAGDQLVVENDYKVKTK